MNSPDPTSIITGNYYPGLLQEPADKPLRIALVAPMIVKSATGLSSYIRELVPRLCDLGHRVTVVASDCANHGADAGELIEVDSRADLKLFRVIGKLNRRLYR